MKDIDVGEDINNRVVFASDQYDFLGQESISDFRK